LFKTMLFECLNKLQFYSGKNVIVMNMCFLNVKNTYFFLGGYRFESRGVESIHVGPL
jgi:hypothetical protein